MQAPPFYPWGSRSSGSLPSTSGAESETSIEAPPSPRGRKRHRQETEEEDGDTIQLLGEAEALELVEFDPSVSPKDSWDPPKAMSEFLQKHFNRTLTVAEREAILKEFPKPNCEALTVPKLDEQVKEQLKTKGKDPHFGSEKTLFKIQDNLLDAAAPLTCLWADLVNKEDTITKEDTLLLLQRALVLLGSASNQISVERRKVAWAKMNPRLKSLAEEDYSKRETNLFGKDLLEKATRRMEADKTLSRVAHNPPAAPANKRARFASDRADLRSFLSKGAPVKYGNRKPQRQQQPYTPRRFQSNKYFQKPKGRPQRSQNS